MPDPRQTIETYFWRHKKNPNRELDSDKLIETSESMARYVQTDLPDTHLVKVAQEVVKVTREAVDKANGINRPIYLFRLIVISILVLLIIGVVHQLWTQPIKNILKFLDDTKGAGMYAIAFLIFFVTVEIRWKRRKVIRAVHELRSIVHIIDMHQLAKDPVIEKFRLKPEERKDTERDRCFIPYLHCCIALTDMLSKVGQLYINHFPDSVATTAVNDFESVAKGVATAIWSKIIATQQSRLLRPTRERHHKHENEQQTVAAESLASSDWPQEHWYDFLPSLYMGR